MPSPLISFLSGRLAGRRAVETIVPERTFDDVILPPATRETLDQALGGERHATGLGLVFNFAGPPGGTRRSSRSRSPAPRSSLPSECSAPCSRDD